jgi:hypothetical protein
VLTRSFINLRGKGAEKVKSGKKAKVNNNAKGGKNDMGVKKDQQLRIVTDPVSSLPVIDPYTGRYIYVSKKSDKKDNFKTDILARLQHTASTSFGARNIFSRTTSTPENVKNKPENIKSKAENVKKKKSTKSLRGL